jgi:RRXRR protein
MPRVPVISKDGKPLMPTKSSRARRWIEEGKAVGKFNDLNPIRIRCETEIGKSDRFGNSGMVRYAVANAPYG